MLLGVVPTNQMVDNHMHLHPLPLTFLGRENQHSVFGV